MTRPAIAPVAAPPTSRATLAYELGHEPVLDGVRGIACLMVMGVHLSALGARQMPGVLPNGFLGVDVFFVLSGFLITSLLLQEWSRTGTLSFKHFYLRRALRLLPALYFFVAILCIVAAVFGWKATLGPKPWLSIGSTLFYFSNWIQDIGGLSITWSLSVEEQFYILWPPTLFLLLRRGVRLPVILGGLVLVVALVGGWRLALWSSQVASEGVMAAFTQGYQRTDTRLDAPLIGCIAALWAAWRGLPKRTVVWDGLAIASVVLIAVACGGEDIRLTLRRPVPDLRLDVLFHGGFTVVALASACLILYMLANARGLASRIVSVAPLAWVGKRSYSLYLWHSFAFYTPATLLGRAADTATASWSGWLLLSAVKLGLAVAFSSISYYAVERRFLRMKNRLTKDATEAAKPPDALTKAA
ncbi:acyltransferase family protein [Pyxidicoccus sp. MSG2]|uniref:acyltransferase family protein n=1 Tax=Pyxidicoccus sp. MSG2 TaxID=2996790 RepID=UPI00226D7CA2|nr:acyltransferase [Pyxidicoccus sp. MSG2]MCY1021025.1 acyltransferase [Pyxidicoccus sp. MSG2]